MARSRRPWSAADARCGRVVVLSHCPLNENVRFPGGATGPGAIPGLAEGPATDGIGIDQMPSPEQRACDGVCMRRLLGLHACAPVRWSLARRLTLAVAPAWTTVRCRRLARPIACDIADHTDSGSEVLGAGGPPHRGGPDHRSTRRDLVAANAVAGRGLFVTRLDRALQARGVTVPDREHDLLAELHDAGAIAT